MKLLYAETFSSHVLCTVGCFAALSFVVLAKHDVVSTKKNSPSNANEVTYKKKSRCFNRGTWNGLWCTCERNYEGRFCHFFRKRPKQDCAGGILKDEAYMKSGCALCYCYNGTINCLPKFFYGCENDPPGKPHNPFGLRPQEIYPVQESDNNYDDYYDDYADDSEAERSRSSSPDRAICLSDNCIICAYVTLLNLLYMTFIQVR